MTDFATNILHDGDPLDILPDGTVHLVYLDPRANSGCDSNVVSRDESGNATDVQRFAYEDTWQGPFK